MTQGQLTPHRNFIVVIVLQLLRFRGMEDALVRPDEPGQERLNSIGVGMNTPYRTLGDGEFLVG